MLMKVFRSILGLATADGAGAAGNGPSAHAFAFTGIDGRPMPLDAYRGRALLIVNTASRCGFTRQYAELQDLWSRYRDRGLVVIGVPSNDFGAQEPGNADEIKSFCALNFGVDFPLTTKERVSGRAAHPFYAWAADELGFGAKPRWNFHKYLVDGNGRLVDWFSTMTPPSSSRLIEAIEAALPPADGLNRGPG